MLGGLAQRQRPHSTDPGRVHVAQIRRYEAGDSQPTLDVIRKLAIALSASAYMLVFDKDERGLDE